MTPKTIPPLISVTQSEQSARANYAFLSGWCTMLLVLSLGILACRSSAAPPEPQQAIVQAQAPTAPDSVQALKQEVEKVSAMMAVQSREIAEQKGTLAVIAERKESGSNAIWAAAAAIFAAVLTGVVAILNQNRQAKQERLLKAIELIMQSRSGYYADVRTKNLSVFLDDATKEHLKDIKTNFAGLEFTELHVGLADAMAQKAKTPEEVLLIWKTILANKKFFEQIVYPPPQP